MELKGKHILVAGLGRTGVAVTRFLSARGAWVSISDAAPEETHGDVIPEMRQLGASMEFGGHRLETFTSADTVVLSPGVPHTIPVILAAREKGIPVIGELELSFRFIQEPMIAVTGTNGKTTTTEMLGRMLEASGLRVFVCGNIGNPVIEYLGLDNPVDMLVVEVSSFQLDTADTFRPRIGVLLNIAEDHLDRYPDMSAYAASKARLFHRHGPGDTAVLNGSDPRIRGIAKGISSRKLVYYGTPHEFSSGAEGAAVNGRRITLATRELPNAEIPRRLLNLPGDYNAENAAASALAAIAAGGTLDGITAALNMYKGLPHRTEHVATIRGILFFNDSKATNVDAVIRALGSFEIPVVLILGGRDKGADFTKLNAIVTKRVKHVVAMGEARHAVLSALGESASVSVATDMTEAVDQAYRVAVAGEAVLLSPACASFDQYDSYADRGEDFRRKVTDLGSGETP
ncbi:UDP-N-acetylmuramoyl-L-alanine--D-glutamate ligase (EC [Olavius algarvensis associated proteobacterium Delta 3]|nr:UDP-N-acetylmuramoyl-L-alanine--D-glutamate ligase (EC [Olavius algarvensis associated proteobacterium Delta 3]